VELLGSSPEYLDRHAHLIEQRLRDKCDGVGDRNLIAMQLRCLAGSELADSDYRILCPTLVIAGEDDRLIPACYARAMSERISDSRFVLMRGTGHNPLQERPDEVIPQITQFLNETADVTRFPHPRADRVPQPAELCP
jgi:pimeloyl-ACP methyl ester carboxylesterase